MILVGLIRGCSQSMSVDETHALTAPSLKVSEKTRLKETNELSAEDTTIDYPLLHPTVEDSSHLIPLELMSMDFGKGNDLKSFYANLCKKEAPLPQMVRLLVMWPSSNSATKLVIEKLNESHSGITTDIPLQVIEESPKPSLSLVQCLEAYTAPESLDSAEYRCPKCHTFNTIQTRITKLPPVLILHLTRFRQRANDSPDGSTKIEHTKSSLLVKFPIKGLVMSKFLTVPKSESKDLLAPGDLGSAYGTDYVYDLTAICNHEGAINSGHYTAFCRSPIDGLWRSFNDTRIQIIDESQLVQPGAYILVYQLRSLIPTCDAGATSHWSKRYFVPKEPVPLAVESPTREPRIERAIRTSPETVIETKPRKIRSPHFDNVYPPQTFIGRSPEVTTSLNDLLSPTSRITRSILPPQPRQPTTVYSKSRLLPFRNEVYENVNRDHNSDMSSYERTRLEISNYSPPSPDRFQFSSPYNVHRSGPTHSGLYPHAKIPVQYSTGAGRSRVETTTVNPYYNRRYGQLAPPKEHDF